MDSLLEVGQIVNTYGIKGFVKVVPYIDNKNQFQDFATLYIEDKKKFTDLEIEEIKFAKELVLVKFKNIETIEEAEKIRNMYLYARREDIKLEEGAHFIVDLIGIQIYNESGELLGILKEVLQPGANDVYVVENENREQILLPVIPEVVKNIDIQGKKIIVHLLDGLKFEK